MEDNQLEEKPNRFYKKLTLVFLFCNCILLLLIMSPIGHYDLGSKSDAPAFIVQQRGDLPASAPMEENTGISSSDETVNLNVFLEWRLVSTQVEGDYKVETYREYELYKNDRGKLLKIVPTPHYNYLRYWIND